MSTPSSASPLPPIASFTVGLKRSGTSLLRSLLDGHPELWVLPRESKTFHWVDSKHPLETFLSSTRYPEVFPDDTPERKRFEAELGPRLKNAGDVPAAILAVAESVAAVNPPPASARLWMEKTPDHLLDVPDLLRRFGRDTRIVCTIRDPRAQIASRARRRQPGEHFPIPRFCRKWALADDLMRRFAVECPGFLLVRYEDIVLQTESTVRRVTDHLGIEWTDELLSPTRDGGEWKGNSSYGHTVSGINSASLERYKEQLEAKQIEDIERLLGPRMLERGYEPTTSDWNGGKAKRWLMELRTRADLRKTARQ